MPPYAEVAQTLVCVFDLKTGKLTKTAELRQAGEILHDDVAPLLAAAGLQLQILRMDHPAAAGQVSEVLATLEGAMDHVRKTEPAACSVPWLTPPGS